MPLTRSSLDVAMSWALSKTNAGSQPTQQADTAKLSAAPTVTTWDQLFRKRFSFTAGSLTGTLDLQSYNNDVGEACVATKALMLLALPVGCDLTVKPGASNPLTWFLPATGIVTRDGGILLYYQPLSQVVSPTARTIDLTAVLSSGITTGTADLVFLAGT